jgi:plasmid stabilization system protein ParE
MPKQVIWSPQSERDLLFILDYLRENWGNSVSVRFIDIVDDLVHQIALHPKLFPLIQRKYQVRKCVVIWHIATTSIFPVKSISLLKT